MTEIKESKLIEYKEEIDHLLNLNGIPFTTEYIHNDNRKENSTLIYSCEFPMGKRAGFICHVKEENIFGGAILKGDRVQYLEMEGFSKEEIDNEPVWLAADSPKMFILMMAYPDVKQVILG